MKKITLVASIALALSSNHVIADNYEPIMIVDSNLSQPIQQNNQYLSGVTEYGEPDFDSHFVKKGGQNVPLAQAIKSIVPAGWYGKKDSLIDPNMRVSWDGGSDFINILTIMGKAYNIAILIDWEGKGVGIHSVSTAPSRLNNEQRQEYTVRLPSNLDTSSNQPQTALPPTPTKVAPVTTTSTSVSVSIKAMSTIESIAQITGLTIQGAKPQDTVISIKPSFDPYQVLRDISKLVPFGLMLDRQNSILKIGEKLTDKAGNPINQLVLVDDGANALALSAANPDTIKNAKLNVLPPPDAVTEVNLLTALEMLKPTDWRVANPFGYSTDIMLNMPHGKPLTQTLADTIRQTPYKLRMDFDAKQLVITDAKNFITSAAN